jgi:hypothetical protein
MQEVTLHHFGALRSMKAFILFPISNTSIRIMSRILTRPHMHHSFRRCNYRLLVNGVTFVTSYDGWGVSAS